MEWISVNDKKPDDGVPVIATYLSTTDEKPCIDILIIWCGLWYRWVGSLEYSVTLDEEVFADVTHWMTAPEPYTDA